MWYEPGYVGEKMIDCLSNCFYFPAKYETRSLDDNVLVVVVGKMEGTIRLF